MIQMIRVGFISKLRPAQPSYGRTRFISRQSLSTFTTTTMTSVVKIRPSLFHMNAFTSSNTPLQSQFQIISHSRRHLSSLTSLSSLNPITAIESILISLHTLPETVPLFQSGMETTLPWWIVIALATFGFRLVITLPLAVQSWMRAQRRARLEPVLQAWDANITKKIAKQNKLQENAAKSHPAYLKEVRTFARNGSAPWNHRFSTTHHTRLYAIDWGQTLRTPEEVLLSGLQKYHSSCGTNPLVHIRVSRHSRPIRVQDSFLPRNRYSSGRHVRGGHTLVREPCSSWPDHDYAASHWDPPCFKCSGKGRYK